MVFSRFIVALWGIETDFGRVLVALMSSLRWSACLMMAAAQLSERADRRPKDH